MVSIPHSEPNGREPTWAVAHLFPFQGEWTEHDFFRLHGNRMVELVDGTLEVLPMPTWLHQLIVRFLIRQIEAAMNPAGFAMAAPLPIKLSERTIREPDVMYFSPSNVPADPSTYPSCVDLVMEVVSEGADARRRDYEEKRRDYATGGIREYWIVDPMEQRITVLVLDGGEYRVHGEYSVGEVASGVLIPELKVSLDDILKLGRV